MILLCLWINSFKLDITLSLNRWKKIIKASLGKYHKGRSHQQSIQKYSKHQYGIMTIRKTMELKKDRTFISFLFVIVLSWIYIKYFASKRGLNEDLALDSIAQSGISFINSDQPLAKQSFYSCGNGLFDRKPFIHSHLNCFRFIFSKPRSYKRSMLFIVLIISKWYAFAVLYSCDDYLQTLFHWDWCQHRTTSSTIWRFFIR
jgi:hypothetical protein